MNILIVEDDSNIAQLMAMHLRDLPAQVTVIHHGWLGLDEAMSGKYDFLVLDLMLPGLGGLEICRQLRQRKQFIPVLMLTAKSEEQDKIAGLEMGADDYLTKPFSPGELLARVRTILRRSQRESRQMEKKLQRIERGALCIDLEMKTVNKGAQRIELTAKEYEILQLFMQNPGRSYTRQEILDEIWGEQFEGLEHTVNSHINRLRAKIEDNLAQPGYILTAWGIGYKFNNEL
ncbi:MAG: response regulator transcription factor [Saprospiraceae bacterium]|nr:response regulator transcription factor [Saprospiraceae bacterium]